MYIYINKCILVWMHHQNWHSYWSLKKSVYLWNIFSYKEILIWTHEKDQSTKLTSIFCKWQEPFDSDNNLVLICKENGDIFPTFSYSIYYWIIYKRRNQMKRTTVLCFCLRVFPAWVKSKAISQISTSISKQLPQEQISISVFSGLPSLWVQINITKTSKISGRKKKVLLRF